jgi:hypothetical protein
MSRTSFVASPIGALAAAGLVTGAIGAQVEPEAIRRLERDQESLRARLDRLESRPTARAQDQRAEDALASLEVGHGALNARLAELEKRRAPSTSFIDVSWNLLGAAGGSTATDGQLEVLELGGHDPNQRGFTLQNGELTLQGAVDPSFRGDAHLVFLIDREGETAVELEEAYLTTLSLPLGLQARAGQYFSEFGRHNPRHPHQWDFVDQPIVNGRMFGGDGLRGPGARLGWLAPTPFFLELQSGIQQAKGETQTSFLANGEVGALAGRPFMDLDVHGPGDLLYVERAVASFDLSDESAVAIGGSFATGPNATGPDGRTDLFGVDVFYRWKRLASDQGWPYFTATFEQIWRSYEADDFEDELGNPFPSETFRDSGLYAQVVWGFARPWSAGCRLDYAEGDGIATGGDGLSDRRIRCSPALTYHPSEFSRVRLQVNLDKAKEIGDDLETSVWLQFEIGFGPHAAHRF